MGHFDHKLPSGQICDSRNVIMSQFVPHGEEPERAGDRGIGGGKLHVGHVVSAETQEQGTLYQHAAPLE